MTHPTDAELREALALAEKATPGPWKQASEYPTSVLIPKSLNCTELSSVVIHAGIAQGEELPSAQYESLYSEALVNAAFIAAARTLLPAAAQALLDARAALREVHQLIVIDYYTGTGAYAPHFLRCGLCSWTWEDGEPESHEATCPLAHLGVLLGEEP